MSTTTSPSPGTAPTPEDIVVHDVVVKPVSRTRRIVTGVVMILVGALTFALGRNAEAHSARFDLSQGSEFIHLPDLVLPVAATAYVCGVLILVLGVLQAVKGFTKPWSTVVGSAVGLLFLLAFFCWAASGGTGSTIDLLGVLENTLGLAAPIILGALGAVLCERSGVINVAIEGQMLAGAWAGAMFGTVIGRSGGVVAALVAGALMGWLLALFSIRYLVNQVVLGVVLNVLALGLTGFLYDALMQPNQDSLNNPGSFDSIAIPVLSKLPLIGPLLFDQNVIVYLMYVLIVVIQVALFRTRWGLRTRAVGEHPKAADTVGINVLRVRYRNVIMGGAIAGLGGAYMTIGAVGSFTKDITSGNGFIALAALIFGRWSPRGAVGAALLFGFAYELQTLLSLVQPPVTIPTNFLAMLPYLATIFAVAGLVGKVRAPAADGEPYVKE
ncbi:Inner-membrane translocator [Nostocoides japonicum T1-X7]|uniref:Inner-membrane translocator n=1 Tax=Nostocoides japonicum T1-X7 TaxID=1194083 RepID=A0A077LYD4_9MICO|nr:ABC transporter permease [Tetrasphaera japonica]CCH78923.1 Inner-membrane translocator [Tetrasphaera japonica T1-X7]